MELCPKCNEGLNKRLISQNRHTYISVYCLNVDCDYQAKEEVNQLQSATQVEKVY